jgi:hypothetical protein
VRRTQAPEAALIGWGGVAAGLACVLLTPFDGRLILAGLLLAGGGAWQVAWTAWMYLRPRRLRAGANGVEIMPRGPLVLWPDVESVSIRPREVGWRLRMTMEASTGRRGRTTRAWTLPPLRTPQNHDMRDALDAVAYALVLLTLLQKDSEARATSGETSTSGVKEHASS